MSGQNEPHQPMDPAAVRAHMIAVSDRNHAEVTDLITQMVAKQRQAIADNPGEDRLTISGRLALKLMYSSLGPFQFGAMVAVAVDMLARQPESAADAAAAAETDQLEKDFNL